MICMFFNRYTVELFLFCIHISEIQTTNPEVVGHGLIGGLNLVVLLCIWTKILIYVKMVSSMILLYDAKCTTLHANLEDRACEVELNVVLAMLDPILR